MDTYAILNSTDQQGKKLQKTITNVNPNADADKLKTWIQGINSLSTNTVSGISRVDKTDLLNGETSTKLSRNLKAILYDEIHETEVTTLSQAQLPTETWNYEGNAAVVLQYDGDDITIGDISVSMAQLPETVSNSGYIGVVVCEQPVTVGGEQVNGYVVGVSKTTGGSGANIVQGASLTVHLPETDTYQAASLTISIVA